MADAKALRRYQAGIERALALFDAASEWADYIAFLSRLLKSLQGPPENVEIPLKTTIADCLEECLQPSLPSGVHQKALEVYDLIFSVIGQDGLRRDLPLYFSGLSETLSFASLSTRPQFMALFDDYILNLPAPVLRPAITGLITSLLPGIEEETSEDFDKAMRTFNRLREKFVDDKHEEIFWQNLFLSSITDPHRRAGVLVYLIRYMPKLESQSSSGRANGETHPVSGAEKAVINPEPGLLVRCFATGLQDSQPLVQRGFLDLLVTHLPLDATIFANSAHHHDLDVLMDASAAIVLRRDMGLNRRLWAWYTGSESKGSAATHDVGAADMIQSPTAVQSDLQNAHYFAQNGLSSLIRSISAMLKHQSNDSSYRARPFRIALSLMDRWEIGGPVVESLFVPLLKSLLSYQTTAPSQEAFDEVYRSANVFFDGIESSMVASQLVLILEKQQTDLGLFIVTNFNLEEEDMVKSHIPRICLVIVETIRQLVNNGTSDAQLQTQNAVKLSQVLEDLLVLVPAGMLGDAQSSELTTQDLKHQILQGYTETLSASNSVGRHSMPSVNVVGTLLVESVFECLQECLSSPALPSDILAHMLACTNLCIALTNGFETLRRIDFLSRLYNNSRNSAKLPGARSYQIVTGIASLITTLQSRDPLNELLAPSDLCNLVPSLVEQLWYFLLSQSHVEAVESVWRLHAITRSLGLVESTITSLLVSELAESSSKEECMQRFGALWLHSRLAAKQVHGQVNESQGLNSDDILDLLRYPLLLVIDAIDDSINTHPCAAWTRSLTSLNSLFGVVFQQMPKDMTDSSNMGIALQRLSKLISLAKANEPQWKAFSGKSGYRDPVFELCSSLTSNQAVFNSLGVEALQVVRLLIGKDGMELGDDMLKMLSTRLVASYDMEQFQDSLLDTLQIAFSSATPPSQPDYLLPILLEGITSTAIDLTLDKWITLLCTIVPLLGTSSLFANMIKITTCLCKRVDLYFQLLQDSYKGSSEETTNGFQALNLLSVRSERSISNLLAGMEYVLARAHNQASLAKNEQEAKVNGPAPDLPSSRASANDHLTVILCMQDALKICARLWLWRAVGKATTVVVDTKSLHYMTSRLRARSRRILENLVEAEPQECLETLMGLWVERRLQNTQHSLILELLQTLDGARPKFMMPATFNAIYNRTNPTALDQSQKSSLSVNVNAIELIAFLNDYTNALEDDLLDEIWTDCTAFLKEVLSNPMPHRQILFKLLEFTAVLCRKMENTNFGEESRMRRELADLCVRLFTAIFTIKPQGLDGSAVSSSDIKAVFDKKRSATRSSIQAENCLQILQDTLPDLSLVLTQSNHLTGVYNSIASQITGPILHSRQYPQNITAELLVLLQTMSTAPAATKAWRKDVSDAFNDTKFFQTQVDLVELGWIPLVRQMVLAEKAVMVELLSRLAPPAAAGLMFGVGANAARNEADRKTQSTLRRVALVMLSMETDYFVPTLQPLLVKLKELLTATPESSPSSNSRADVYITLRAIILTFSESQLSTVWPLVNRELRNLCAAIIAKDVSKFTLTAQLQGAKLLDVLLLMKLSAFRPRAWLFVTDTMDAIYSPAESQPVALVDQIKLGSLERAVSHFEAKTSTTKMLKIPWLCRDESRNQEMTGSLLSSFFTNLSIRTFEGNYSLQDLDMDACRQDLIKDLFLE